VPGDEVALALLRQATFLETYAGAADANEIIAYVTEGSMPAVFHAWLSGDHVQVWAIETDGRALVGYLTAGTNEYSDGSASLEISHLYVYHRFHRMGLGTALMNEAVASARAANLPEIMLKMHDVNEQALAFYTRFGFRVIDNAPMAAGGNTYTVSILKLSLNSASAW
jgi:ribosomal protein S18 acetylase RimI-like enzyme